MRGTPAVCFSLSGPFLRLRTWPRGVATDSFSSRMTRRLIPLYRNHPKPMSMRPSFRASVCSSVVRSKSAISTSGAVSRNRRISSGNNCSLSVGFHEPDAELPPLARSAAAEPWPGSHRCRWSTLPRLLEKITPQLRQSEQGPDVHNEGASTGAKQPYEELTKTQFSRTTADGLLADRPGGYRPSRAC